MPLHPVPSPARDPLVPSPAATTPAGRPHIRTVEIADPGPLEQLLVTLPGLPTADLTVWLRGGDGMIGLGRALEHRPRSLDEGATWWRETCARWDLTGEGPGPVAFGSFVFDPDGSRAESRLVVPRLLVRRTRGRVLVTAIDTEPVLPAPAAPVPPQPGPVAYADGALSGPRWQTAVATAIDRIQRAGAWPDRLDKVVLARDLHATAAAPLDAGRLAASLARDYRRCWTFAVDGLVGATPEMLVRLDDGLATSRVLAGTIRRDGDADRDLALAAALSRSGKDLAEHEYAVASVAERLAEFCSGMNVPESPSVLELPNVLHLATDVTAVAHPGISALDLAGALHPSAAVCGTPTDVARRTIRELEQMDRGRYAGPVGWVDAAGDGEWGIALRCGQIAPDDPRQIRLFAGCGIVASSDPASELAESIAKLVPMRDALDRG